MHIIVFYVYLVLFMAFNLIFMYFDFHYAQQICRRVRLLGNRGIGHKQYVYVYNKFVKTTRRRKYNFILFYFVLVLVLVFIRFAQFARVLRYNFVGVTPDLLSKTNKKYKKISAVDDRSFLCAQII